MTRTNGLKPVLKRAMAGPAKGKLIDPLTNLPVPSNLDRPKHMTKSQRKVVADDPYRRKGDKWNKMTVAFIDPTTGLALKRTVTASTGREHHCSLVSRRGKETTL